MVEIQTPELNRVLRLLEDCMDDAAATNEWDIYDSLMEAYGILSEYAE